MDTNYLSENQMRNAIAVLRKTCFRPRARRPRDLMYPQYLFFNDDNDGVEHGNFQTHPYISQYSENVVVFNGAQEIVDSIGCWKSQL